MARGPAPLPPKTAAGADAFGFAGADGAESLARNWWALMTLPWAVVWAVQAEMIEETLRRLGL
ncbi:hypothetical protein [uncultured Albimonas sp.]|uniref:hypothetical protein n=1 Tax=uncultured Albimonas sp. TaxID=1331701 RepID=UPI0030EF634C|tara:strand:+ start:1316 stop:1504 length:189 start_codon:yes stop_codon:yes gene_type:complete